MNHPAAADRSVRCDESQGRMGHGAVRLQNAIAQQGENRQAVPWPATHGLDNWQDGGWIEDVQAPERHAQLTVVQAASLSARTSPISTS